MPAYEHLARDIAAAATDPDDAAELCRDLAMAENLDSGQYFDLVTLVERVTGWGLPEEDERF